jgi:hypothetical protein
MRRSPVSGSWCGYVAVPPGHPWHGKSWHGDDFPEIEVHGGVTFSGACEGDVCHKPEPGEPDDVWWQGFDCNHAYDVCPLVVAMARRHGFPEFGMDKYGTYRDVAFVRQEVQSLAEQALAVATK